MDVNHGLVVFGNALRKLMADADKDGGKTYDNLAARIRAHQADGLIEEALGYIPEDLATSPEGDAFKVRKKFGRNGKLSCDSKMSKFSAGQVDRMIFED